MTTSSNPAPAPALTPNHHAHHPGFSGVTGWLAALSMRAGRTRDASLAIELTGMLTGHRVVDIGCGPGVAARLGASRGAVVTGVDPAEVMLRMARRADRGRQVTWVQGVAERLPVADDSQDIAWALATVHHWPDLEGGLSEVRRVVVDGGRCLAIERRAPAGATGHASHGWTSQQADTFAQMCTDAGFVSVEVSTHQSRRGELIAVLAVVG